MTTKELAIHLTMLLNDCGQWCLTDDESEFYHCGIDGSGYYAVPVIDIMDWNLLMPIAVEHGVSSIFGDDVCIASDDIYSYACCDEDVITATDKIPQIAIAKCLITKLENQNEN